MKQAKHAQRVHVSVLVQNERDKYIIASRISHRLLVPLSPESRVCLRLKINDVYGECPYKWSYIYNSVLIQMMRAKWANINKDHTTEVCALSLSLSPSLPTLSNLCIVLLTCFWHIQRIYKLSSDVCEKEIVTRQPRASVPPRAQFSPHALLISSHTSAIQLSVVLLSVFLWV